MGWGGDFWPWGGGPYWPGFHRTMMTSAVQEHLGDVVVLAEWLALLRLAILRNLGPHLLYPLQHHVAVPVKGLHVWHRSFLLWQLMNTGCCFRPTTGGMEHGPMLSSSLCFLSSSAPSAHLTLGFIEEAHGDGGCALRSLLSPPCCFGLCRESSANLNCLPLVGNQARKSYVAHWVVLCRLQVMWLSEKNNDCLAKWETCFSLEWAMSFLWFLVHSN